ncbi:energy-coupling factor ABC transporter ATP-binding protein [Corynebacterium aquilae]|uniref:Cobalt ABC transporter ATP-binding protein n=1 Tax=Corynebacterium aquilae DSM 44791 TaxID=1431546 RepID=A0A1L7CGI7_9CORY|nr:ABC transporter ATP-binding protein [Corynebacterium aquilae]APT84934.1 cobalt ABC transporter ATP-binding protein [Corynebacterium aquilae DSM 44791]
MVNVSFNGVNYQPPNVDHPLLEDITTTITEKRVAIIGANGGGKSTFARMINGLYSPTSGLVTVNGLDATTDGKKVRQKVGFVFSDADNQIIMPTVLEDVEFSLRKKIKNKAERKARALEELHRFGLETRAEQSPHTLSGGQKQLLALTSVCVMRPELVIADEPTTLLDLKNRLILKDVFETLEQSMYVVTHDLDFIKDFERALLIDQGRIIADDTVASVTDFYIRKMTGA